MWSKILSGIANALLGSVLSWWGARKDEKERIETIRNEAILEVENAALKALEEARERSDRVVPVDRAGAAKRMRDGTF